MRGLFQPRCHAPSTLTRPAHPFARRRAASSLAAAQAHPLASLARQLPHGRCPWHGAGCAGHSTAPALATDYAFEVATSTIRFGAGVTREIGADVAGSGAQRVMLFTDPNLAALGARGPVGRALDSLTAAGFTPASGRLNVFSACRVEPTDASFAAAIEEAKRFRADAFVAVGGGSVMDTAKAANLYSSHPDAAFLDFVNAPIGRGLPVPGPVKPLFALPTTAGTGSETTGVAIFDYRCARRRPRAHPLCCRLTHPPPTPTRPRLQPAARETGHRLPRAEAHPGPGGPR